MKTFDEWVDTNFKNLTRSTKVFMKEAYEAGAKSRQAEIDELKKQLDNAIKTNEMLVAYKNELLDELQCVIKGETK